MSYYNQGYEFNNTGYPNANNQGYGMNQGYNSSNQGYNNNGQAYPSSYPSQQYNAQGYNNGGNGGAVDNSYGYNYNNNWGYGYGQGQGAQPTSTPRKKQKPKLENFHCDVCDVNCAGQDAYNTHITGKKHAIQSRKKLAASNNNNEQRYSPYPAPSNTTSNNTPTTATTTTTTTTPTTTTSTSPANPTTAIGPSPAPTVAKAHSKFYCDLCDCSSTDHNTFNLHLMGKKHQSTLTKKNRAAAVAPQPPTSSGNTSPALSESPASVDGAPPQPAAADGVAGAQPPTSPAGVQQNPRGHAFSHYKKNRPGPVRRHQQRTSSRAPPVAVAMSPTDANADNLLNAKHAELCPSSTTTLALSNLVSLLTNRLSELGRSNDTPGIIVNEVKLVGAYARGTLIKYNPTADIVVITKDPPNTTTVATLHDILVRTVADTNVSFDPESTEILVQDNGFAVRVMVSWLGAWSASKKIVIMVHEEDKVIESKQEVVTASIPEQPALITTTTNTMTEITTHTTQVADVAEIKTTTMDAEATPVPIVEPAVVEAISAGEADGKELIVPQAGTLATVEPNKALIPAENLEGVNIAACQHALLSIRQMIWFNDNSMCPNLRNVLRLLMDFRSRVAEFQSLSPWALEVIIVNALRGTPQTASISQSMRSLFAYIASGVLLPGVDLIDPCEHEPVHVLRTLTPNQRLEVTAVAQEVIREIAYGKWERVVGV